MITAFWLVSAFTTCMITDGCREPVVIMQFVNAPARPGQPTLWSHLTGAPSPA